ncbi:lysophospholipid acyltransferase family protein [Aurantiacibacter sp. D1-12]|uniref:lysophospholipid acyltransferase family protein n=1 Tax=Aurantiacibacter sp. D1-12 TaxID=2993658 RepID=UPI00237D0AA2|nr:lysophospholipid acyltransferase family protein [Aurantiacibacter sp. D1-12]MDE1467915.1 lysophospholipid acyltransferase family protein [Aurantiacibacter sp. D1-12]
MAPTVTYPELRISPLGYMLIIFRILLMLMLVLICVPLHYLWRLLGLRRMWPRVFLTGISLAAGIDLKRKGKRVPNALLLANHVSWMDIPALSHAANSAFVAHDGLAQFGLLKWLCDMNDTVFIARHKRTDVSNQANDIREAMSGDGTLTLFPEGTTSDGTANLLPFKSSLLGALEPLPVGAVVQPVLLEYHDAPDVSWVGDEPGLDNFKRILSRVKPVRLTVHFLTPLSGEELTNRKTMTAAAQRAVREAML